jgi:hypothetical protein
MAARVASAMNHQLTISVHTHLPPTCRHFLKHQLTMTFGLNFFVGSGLSASMRLDAAKEQALLPKAWAQRKQGGYLFA